MEQRNPYLEALGRSAKTASFALRTASTGEKNRLLAAVRDSLLQQQELVLRENQEDMRAAQANGLSPAMAGPALPYSRPDSGHGRSH